MNTNQWLFIGILNGISLLIWLILSVKFYSLHRDRLKLIATIDQTFNPQITHWRSILPVIYLIFVIISLIITIILP